MPHVELQIAGQAVPSVTQLLDVMDKSWLRPWFAKEELNRCIEELKECEPASVKPLLTMWRKRLREKDYAATTKGKEAADIGTEFHDNVERFLKGETVSPASPVVRAMFHEFHRFHGEMQFKPLALEKHVVSKRYVYQGTFDYIGEDSKTPGLGLWDWKTSNKIDDTFGLQVALYAYAYGEQEGWTEDETWKRITHGGTVRLDKRTGALEHKLYDNLPYLFRVAASLREPYDYRNQVGVWEADNV